MNPSICFAHANGFPAGSYRKLIAELTTEYRVYAPDMLGHDSRFPVDENWQSLTQELIAYIETHADQPVIGIGHSLGGVLTLKAAVQRPDLFRAFVMLDPPAFLGAGAYLLRLAKRVGGIDRVTPAGVTRRRRRRWPSRQAAYDSLRDKAFFRNFEPECFRDYIDCVTIERDDGVHLRYRPEIEVEIFRHLPHDLPTLPRVDVPGAIIRGEQSDVARRFDMRNLAHRHGLKLLYMPGGHMFPLERPQETGRKLLELLPQLLEQAAPA